jgi:proteasome accessory factor A
VWAGAGHVVSGGASVDSGVGAGVGVGHGLGSGYELTQRADVLDEAVSSATTRVRPMINTRDEPHANPDEFRRLHVIVGDSNRSQTSTWLRLATTHLVLCMIEESVRERSAGDAGSLGGNGSFSAGDVGVMSEQLDALISVLPSMAREDPTALMKATSRGERDAVRDAFATQRLFCDAAAAFAREHREGLVSSGSIGEYELDEALRTWDEAIASGEYAFTAAANEEESDSRALDSGSAASGDSALSGAFIANLAEQMPAWVEWAAKLRLLEAFRARHADSTDAGATAAALEQIELAYHDIAASTVFEGLAKQEDAEVREEGDFGGGASSGLTRVSAREVKLAMSEPPMGTRAMVRGEFVRKALSSHAEWSCDWTRLEVHDSTGQHHEARLFDPFDDDMFSGNVREVFAALDGE